MIVTSVAILNTIYYSNVRTRKKIYNYVWKIRINLHKITKQIKNWTIINRIKTCFHSGNVGKQSPYEFQESDLQITSWKPFDIKHGQRSSWNQYAFYGHTGCYFILSIPKHRTCRERIVFL